MCDSVVWIKGGALGDFILGLPSLVALRRRLPRARITAVGPRAWLPLIQDLADELEALEDPPWSSLGRPSWSAGGRRWDVALLLRPDPDGSMVRGLGAAGVGRINQLHPRPEESAPDHIARHGMGILDGLGGSADPPVVTIEPTAEELTEARRRLSSAGSDPGDVAVLLPGSGGAGKRWPAERFHHLGLALVRQGVRVAVALGPVEIEAGEAPRWRALGWPVLEALPPRALGAALSLARVAVGNDAGTTHLAALYGCPVVALFGPTDPERWAPPGRRVRIVSPERPCPPGCRSVQVGMRRCEQAPAGAPARCLSLIDGPEVLAAVQGLLSARWGRAQAPLSPMRGEAEAEEES